MKKKLTLTIVWAMSMFGLSAQAPSNLTATFQTNPSPRVNLSWNDNSANELFFSIERSANNQNNFSQIAISPSNSTTYTDNFIQENTTYFYRVRAFLFANYTSFSNIAEVYTGIQAWLTDGNIASPADYLGTNNNQDLRIFTNGQQRMVVKADGNVGIGSFNPSAKLTVIDNNPKILFRTSAVASSRGGFLEALDDKGLTLGTMANGFELKGFSIIPEPFISGPQVFNKNKYTWETGVDGEDPYMTLTTLGNLGIGTVNPDVTFKLSVNGRIRAKEIIVETNWSDFVFEKNYYLKTLTEVEAFINNNGHLPGIPSAKEVELNGIALGDMDAKLLMKIEELTLYLIQQNNLMKEQEEDIQYLKKKLELAVTEK